MAKKDDNAPDSDGISVPLEHVTPEDLPTVYANHVVVLRDKHDMFIQFFEVRPPIVLGGPVERRKQTEGIKKLKATCVARIAIAPSRLPSLIEALQEQHRKFVEESKDSGD